MLFIGDQTTTTDCGEQHAQRAGEKHVVFLLLFLLAFSVSLKVRRLEVVVNFVLLYNDLPFKFRMSPLEDIENDLREVKRATKDWNSGRTRRVFLTGANPFALSYDKLTAIAELIRKYLPSVKSIGSFARITDVTPKTDKELAKLRDMGYDGLTIGIETGDDEALRFMNKGYTSADIIEQCQRLDAAGIHYSFFYLVSISGAGRGEIGQN